MVIYSYDGSFSGFLSAVYQVFLDRLPPCKITSDTRAALFEKRLVATDKQRCCKVEKKLLSLQNKEDFQNILYAFYSNVDGIENLLLTYIKGLLTSNKVDMEIFLKISKISLAVRREAHSYLGFVRFKESEDGTIYSKIEPDYDILPLIAGHFQRRFRNKTWAIYDVKRKYAVTNFDGKINFINLLAQAPVSELESINQKLWKEYFSSISIQERRNPKLQKKMMPKRYIAHLTEMEN